MRHDKTIKLPLLFAASLLAASQAQAAIGIYISPPDNQNVQAGDFGAEATYVFTTETFTLDTGAFAPGGVSDNGGTYTVASTPVNVSSNPAYGGGTGQGNYLSINNGGSVTITFETPVNYFGFQWTAGNGGNQVTLFGENGENLGAFDTATITTMLPNNSTSTITAVNGDTYNTIDYYGVPGNRTTTSNEPFAYLHFINEGGAPIARIELSHTGGGAFESDNHSTRVGVVTLDEDTSPLVRVGDVPLIPEPSTALLAGLAGFLGILRRRRI